ncbi:hypothetical protein [Paraferrimonas sp. SM1919]|uniref:hypothetical protein n=1 Tax=Paraferrimonas sp. SM1919 TaxID=2662263 RepID=UPI0013D34ACB|nr:hypothetical protein [Paraferrimonas sp. SM1919]
MTNRQIGQGTAPIAVHTEVANYRIKQCLGRFSCGFYYLATNELDQKNYLIFEWCPEYAIRQDDQSLRVKQQQHYHYQQGIERLSKPQTSKGYQAPLAILNHFNTVYQVYCYFSAQPIERSEAGLKQLLAGINQVPILHQDLLDGFSCYSAEQGWQFIEPWLQVEDDSCSLKQLLLSQLVEDNESIKQWPQLDAGEQLQRLTGFDNELAALIIHSDDDLLSLFKHFKIKSPTPSNSYYRAMIAGMFALLLMVGYWWLQPIQSPCMLDNSCPPQINTLDVAEQLAIANEYHQQYLFLLQQMQQLRKQVDGVSLHPEVEALISTLNFEGRLTEVAKVEQQATLKFQQDEYQQALNLFHQAISQLQQMFAELKSLPQLSDLKQQTSQAHSQLDKIKVLYLPKGLLDLQAYSQQAWQQLTNDPAVWLKQYQSGLQQFVDGVNSIAQIVKANGTIRSSYEAAKALPKAATKDLISLAEVTALEAKIKQSVSIAALQEFAKKLASQAADYQHLVELNQRAKVIDKQLADSQQQLLTALKPLKIQEFNRDYQSQLKALWRQGELEAYIKLGQQHKDANNRLTALAKRHWGYQRDVNSKLAALKMWQQKGKLSAADYQYYRGASTNVFAKKAEDLSILTGKLKVMLTTVTDKLLSLDNQYQAHQLAYQDWLLNVETTELELESLNQEIDDVKEDLRGLGSSDSERCQQGFWSMLGDSLEVAACDSQCTRTVYVSGFPYQQVDQYCKNACVAKAEAKQAQAERERQACIDKASDNLTKKWQLEERLEVLQEDKQRSKRRLQSLKQNEPSW